MMDESLAGRLVQVRLVITDVDGVLTDGGMYYGETGEEMKKFNVRDGAGVALLKQVGIPVGVMTGEHTELVVRRAQKIGADFLFQGVFDKAECLRSVLATRGLESVHVAYVGDEINDLCLAGRVGVFLAPADANPVVCDKADTTLSARGGEGVLREAAILILNARGELETAVGRYTAERSGRGALSPAAEFLDLAPASPEEPS